MKAMMMMDFKSSSQASHSLALLSILKEGEYYDSGLTSLYILFRILHWLIVVAKTYRI
jgi:hypothetical protein